jgi:pimeloyl-ACP methyl ester carboxylesterase
MLEPSKRSSNRKKVSPNAEEYAKDSLQGGDTFEGPYGSTRYYMLNKNGSKKVVLIHGIGLNSLAWKDAANELSKNDCQVLVYDLFGRGYSSTPNLVYDMNLYVMQLVQLLHKIGWNSDITLVGWSLGGLIAASYGSNYPETLSELILIAPAGLLTSKSFLLKLLWLVKMPIIGRLIFSAFGMSFMKNSMKPKRLQDGFPPEEVDVSVNLCQISHDHAEYHRGFKFAYISTILNAPLSTGDQIFSVAGENFKGKKSVIWGEKDIICEYELSTEVCKLLGGASLTTIPNASHDVPCTHPSDIAKCILGKQ